MRVGDAGVWGGPPVELPNGRLLSKALDNRLGAYIALEAARRIAEAGDAQVDVVAVAAVQEEIGSYGARAAAYGLDPQVAIAIDVTPATDVPGGDPRRAGAIELGMGAMIARGPTLNKQLTDLLGETAEAEGIAHAFEVYSRTTHDRRRRVPPRARGHPDRPDLDPDALPAQPERDVRPRRRRGRSSQLIVAFARRLDARRRRSSADGGAQRHRQRGPHAVRQARRRARGARGDRARRAS